RTASGNLTLRTTGFSSPQSLKHARLIFHRDLRQRHLPTSPLRERSSLAAAPEAGVLFRAAAAAASASPREPLLRAEDIRAPALQRSQPQQGFLKVEQFLSRETTATPAARVSPDCHATAATASVLPAGPVGWLSHLQPGPPCFRNRAR